MSCIAMSLLRVSAALIFAGHLIGPVRAQQVESKAPYPAGSQITFQWNYSCPGGRGCSFDCPGRGGAGHVTKLTLYLGTIPFGSSKDSPAVFYEFSTSEIPRGSGFTISAGLSTLSCQVNGMT